MRASIFIHTGSRDRMLYPIRSPKSEVEKEQRRVMSDEWGHAMACPYHRDIGGWRDVVR